jgi:hypothetical protein
MKIHQSTQEGIQAGEIKEDTRPEEKTEGIHQEEMKDLRDIIMERKKNIAIIQDIQEGQIEKERTEVYLTLFHQV